MSTLKDLILGMADVDNVKRHVSDALRSGEEPSKVIDVLNDALEEVGRRYESGEYFLSELMMAGILATEATKILDAHMAGGKRSKIAKVVMGTVKGDIHDIGKNIVKDMLEAAGFEVHDLGIDVPVQHFVGKIRETKPQIVGISALLTAATETMKGTVDAIKDAGLRGRVKVIIGGNLVDETVRTYVGADRFTKSAAEGVEICKKWVEA